VSEIHIKVIYRAYKPFCISPVNWVSKCFSKVGQTAVRTLAILVMFVGALLPARGTTLLQLGLAEMAQKSTAIARVRVTGSSEILRGRDVYTLYRFTTLETLKTPAGQSVQEVAVPGGAAGGIRQVVAGAPVLHPGGEYIVFLWTSRSGLTQIIGLSQGLFSVAGDARVTRAASEEQMLDGRGHPVDADTLTMAWTDLKMQVRRALRTPVGTSAVGAR
jgi:hypothetical protein